jgi:drug/metabolite transporter (DMT)-like permease
MIHSHANDSRLRPSQLAPALIAATSFACADVMTKLTLQAGADALTLGVFRGLIGLPLLALWLRIGARPVALSPRARRIALGIGVLFAGNVFWLFKAFEIIEVPVTVLTYFVYPLLTGLAAAATGLEPLGLRGAIAAVTAFLGLALMIGAHPSGVALAGILFSLAAAVCRVVILLVTRARLVGTDMRLVTWYSIISATAVFVLTALATANWQVPQTPLGWSAMIGSSVAMTIAVSAVFISTVRVGPFRTALFMNLEPLLATLGSAVVLGEGLAPLQAVGGAVMIAALVAFQVRR